MSDFQINDYILTKECEALAAAIFAEMLQGMAEDETPDDYRDDMNDRAHEAADGHQWVIYYHKAHMLCAHCDTSNGEQFLEDTGLPSVVTYDSLGTIIAYGEMRARIETELQALCDAWEAAQDEAVE